jgi:glutaminase
MTPNTAPSIDYQDVLERIYAAVMPQVQLAQYGKVASYIPELAGVPAQQFGMSIVTLEGQVFSVGDAKKAFSIQSISKLFALCLAMIAEGDSVWERVGREPSGTAFNSLVQLETEGGKPRNPFINAGALVVTDMLATRHVSPEIALLDFCRKLANNPALQYSPAVARSERQNSHRNAAMAYFMKSFDNLRNPVREVLDAYCKHCAIEMSCEDLARAVGFLANRGTVPRTQEALLDSSTAKRLAALMLTCGTYDAAGDFAFRVGLPAKSGVGGGIVALIPGVAGVCVWSPALDETGNSFAGSVALEMLTTLSGQSVF